MASYAGNGLAFPRYAGEGVARIARARVDRKDSPRWHAHTEPLRLDMAAYRRVRREAGRCADQRCIGALEGLASAKRGSSCEHAPRAATTRRACHWHKECSMTDTLDVSMGKPSMGSLSTHAVCLFRNIPRYVRSAGDGCIPTDVLEALRDARRTSGWNFRQLHVRRFRVGSCDLVVVPFRCWRRQRTGLR